MLKRTFFRIMFDNLFVNNALCKTLRAIIKYFREQQDFRGNNLTFSNTLQFKKKERDIYSKKFIFMVDNNNGAFRQ